MKRIDSVNARPDENGLGKAGFNDNADLPGQDATYVTPGWFNTVQEELCNLLELRGITLDPASKRQLYDLLTTQVDLEALADEIETNFVRKNQIVDNLTTNDADKVASAGTVKELQDNKLDKNALNNTLNSVSTIQALTAAQGKVLNDQAFGVGQTRYDVTASRVPNTGYTNTTSKTMFVSIKVVGGSGFSEATLYVDDEFAAAADPGSADYSGMIYAFVNPGETYKLVQGTALAKTWLEYR